MVFVFPYFSFCWFYKAIGRIKEFLKGRFWSAPAIGSRNQRRAKDNWQGMALCCERQTPSTLHQFSMDFLSRLTYPVLWLNRNWLSISRSIIWISSNAECFYENITDTMFLSFFLSLFDFSDIEKKYVNFKKRKKKKLDANINHLFPKQVNVHHA